MGENERGIRDGSGPYEDSFQRIGEGKNIGRRQENGEPCPNPKEAPNQNIKEED